MTFVIVREIEIDDNRRQSMKRMSTMRIRFDPHSGRERQEVGSRIPQITEFEGHRVPITSTALQNL